MAKGSGEAMGGVQGGEKHDQNILYEKFKVFMCMFVYCMYIYMNIAHREQKRALKVEHVLGHEGRRHGHMVSAG